MSDRARGVGTDSPPCDLSDADTAHPAELRRLLEASTDPHSRAVVLTGPPGIGKTTLLDQVARRVGTSGGRVLRAGGSPAEADLPFATLHQLLRPVAGVISELPARQRTALQAAFGSGTPGDPPDPMLIGVAVLTLLSDLATGAPVLVLLDDAQWADHASLDVLAFVARRNGDDPVSMAIATGEPAALPGVDGHWTTLELAPLERPAAERLLDRLPRPPAGETRTRVLDQGEGNPLALVELARTAGSDAGPWTSGNPLPIAARLERRWIGRLNGLEPAARQWLLVLALAADDPAETVLTLLPGPADPMWTALEGAGLIDRTGSRVSFRHPLVRSAVYQAASFDERRAAHHALASALAEDPDRRAWHLAAATTGADPEVAAALEDSAGRARRRGGYAAAARALERAAELSADRADRVRLIVAATDMAVMTGQLVWVERLAARTRAWTDEPTPLAVAALQTGRLMALTSSPTAAFQQLMSAARQLTTAHPEGALQALAAAAVVRFYSGAESQREEIGAALSDVLRAQSATSVPLLGRWLTAVADPREGAGLRAELAQLITAARQHPEQLHLLAIAAWILDETALAVRAFEASLALWSSAGPLPDGLGGVAALAHLEHGRVARAQAFCTELAAVADTYGLDHAAGCAAAVDALATAVRGDTANAHELAARALSLIDPAESRSVAVYAYRALGVSAAVTGNHEDAYACFRAAFGADGGPVHYHASVAALPELTAAAVRSGRHHQAADVVECTVRSGETHSVRARVLIHHSQALLADPDHAETHFRAALTLSGPADRPFEHARILLDLAEWLRRRRRIAEARPLLHECHNVFRRLGARPWATRAEAELRASGAQIAAAEPAAFGELTPQQQQVVRLAALGRTNREIGESLFLSPRTVSSHLYRAFPKLGITSRTQLRDVLDAAVISCT
ncbi:MAG: helix-turn-helix transcriptional regulator [Actinomycetota bacterium]|nr:LuxR family transcriptional regulator [Pseudonocardia antarctica]